MCGSLLTNRPPQPIALPSGNLGELQEEFPFGLGQDSSGGFEINNQPAAFSKRLFVLVLQPLHLCTRDLYLYFSRHLSD
jgi:hypothetical protein